MKHTFKCDVFHVELSYDGERTTMTCSYMNPKHIGSFRELGIASCDVLELWLDSTYLPGRKDIEQDEYKAKVLHRTENRSDYMERVNNFITCCKKYPIKTRKAYHPDWM